MCIICFICCVYVLGGMSYLYIKYSSRVLANSLATECVRGMLSEVNSLATECVHGMLSEVICGIV